MHKPLLIIPLILLSSCSPGFSNEQTFCENTFTLITDYNNRYPDEKPYKELFINSSEVVLYNYKNSEGHNCHYLMNYKSGEIVDEWGVYTIDKSNLSLELDNGDNLSFSFTHYGSPTIDYILIGTTTYEDELYHLIYTAKYIFTAQG